MEERERARQKIELFSDHVRGVLGVRAAFRTLDSLGMEGDAEINIRSIPTVRALFSCTVALYYNDEKYLDFCSITGARAGEVSGTHGRTYSSPCGIGVSRVAGAIGEGTFDPEAFSIAIAPRGQLAQIPFSPGQSLRYAEFWNDVALLESGELGSALLSKRMWPTASLDRIDTKAIERLIKVLSGKGGQFWSDWVENYTFSGPMNFAVCKEVNDCILEFWGVSRSELQELVGKVYELSKIKNRIKNCLRETVSLLPAPGIGHNSQSGFDTQTSDLRETLAEIDDQLTSKTPDRAKLTKSIGRLKSFIEVVGNLISDVASDYAKDALKAMFGAGLAYIIAKWPQIEGKLREIVYLVEQLCKNI